MPSVQSAKEEPILKVEQPNKEENSAEKPYYDVVNVSEGFQLRTAYKKKVKPSRLDGLLERRVKQFTLEEKQRLEKMRQASLLSKISAAKSGVKTEGGTAGKQQVGVSPSVKEEKEEVKDNVVKKLNFEQETTEIKADSTETNHSTQKEGSAGNGADVAHQEINGGSTELNSTNKSLSDVSEGKQKQDVARVVENTKKRAYEEIESKDGSMQLNGRAGVSNSDTENQVQEDLKEPQKEPVKSLMNGNISQNNVEDVCHQPPAKVPKLENHMAEKSEGTESAPSVNNNNDADKNSSSDCVKTSAESQNAMQPDRKSQAANSAISSVITSRAAVPQKPKTSSSMTISKEYSTRDRVSLLRFSKSKKARSGTALPSYRKFVTKSSKKSIFILPNDDLKRLARRSGIREVPIFNYNAKPALDIWPYPSPRPTFGITWRLVLLISVKNT